MNNATVRLWVFFVLILMPAVVEATCVGNVTFSDPTYGATIVRAERPEGHEHNIYYTRRAWNADATRLVGVRSDVNQQNWVVVLYDGAGCYLRDLFSVDEYDWRLAWDRLDPDVLYTWKGSSLYRYHVRAGTAKLLKSFAPLWLSPAGPSLSGDGARILVITSDGAFRSHRVSDMSEERVFVPVLGCDSDVKAERYIGHGDLIVTGCTVLGGAAVTRIYRDTGELVREFPRTFGHTDFAANGQWLWFALGTSPRDGLPGEPLEIHATDLRSGVDRVIFSAPYTPYLRNLHVACASLPVRCVVGFFPYAGLVLESYPPNTPSTYDEIVTLNLEAEPVTVTYLARHGSSASTFWAQPLASPSADGGKLSFNSDAAGTIDQHVLLVPANRR